MSTDWEQRIKDFIENHPDLLEEIGDEKDKGYYLHQKLRMHTSYNEMQMMEAYADLIMHFDLLRDTAYTQLIQDEKQRMAVNAESFKSDAHLKGVISTVAEIKNFIRMRIEGLEDAIKEYENYK